MTYTYRTYVNEKSVRLGKLDEQTMDNIIEYGTRNVLKNNGIWIKRKNCRYVIDNSDVQHIDSNKMIAVNLLMND